MRILVTGGCGFIGSHLVKKLLSMREIERVINLDSLTYAGQPYNLVDVENHRNYKFIHGSINDIELIGEILSSEAIDSIINLAAESHVDRSIGSVNEFIKTNIDGTRCILEQIVEHKNKGVDINLIQVSTDEVYGSLKPEEAPFVEETPLRPMNPYAATKASADMLVQSFVNTHGICAAITRCSNNYGPNQFPEKLIPLMILNSLEGKSLPVYGDGKQIRDWIHVSDHVSGIIATLKAVEENKVDSPFVINFGADNEMTNLEIVETVIEIIGVGREMIQFVSDRPGHDRRYAMGYGKAWELLSWEPLVMWREGITETVEWYLSNPEWIESIRSDEYRTWLENHYGRD